MRNFLRNIRVRLIMMLSGDDIAVMTNITLVGAIYPRGVHTLITNSFLMGNYSSSVSLDGIHDQVKVDVCQI